LALPKERTTGVFFPKPFPMASPSPPHKDFPRQADKKQGFLD
jgi:hypothetical protein